MGTDRREEIFQGRVLRVAVDPVTAGGVTKRIERVYLPGSVHVFVVTDEKKIRVLRERRWDRDGAVHLKVMAGIVEPDERPIETAVRELKEEMGVVATPGHLEHFWTDTYHGTVNDERDYFIARGWAQGRPDPEAGEEIVGTQDFTMDELLEEALTGSEFSAPTTAAIARLHRAVRLGEVEL